MKKAVEDFTQQELASITEEKVELLISYKCMESGIPLLPDLPVEPLSPKIEKEVLTYQFGGLIFDDLSVAVEVREAVIEKREHLLEVQYVSGPSYESVVSPKYEVEDVVTKSYFSPSSYEAQKQSLNDYDRAKEKYRLEKEEYNRIATLREDIADPIWERVNIAIENEKTFIKYRDIFQRYLDLSEGSVDTALTFFREAYSVSDSVIDRLMSETE